MDVLVIYHIFPHYRRPVIQALEQADGHRFTFASDTRDFNGVKAMQVEDFDRFVLAPYHEKRSLGWQPRAISLALTGRFDAYVFLSNPNFLSTWIAAAIARLRGKKVLYWAHGWLYTESPLKARVRNAYYRLANLMMVYNERARALGGKSGYPQQRIKVIYNSLDYARGAELVREIEAESGKAAYPRPQSLFAHAERPMVICTARLIPACQFDLLFKAAARLKTDGKPVNILLVGDGPERRHLEDLAKALDIDVVFYGACYDEAVLARLIYHADLTVSPGKIGLTVIHSMTYGTPAITHGDMDRQMPEVEAIIPGETGAFFTFGDADDLARAMSEWLDQPRDRAEVRRACQAVIARTWNPQNQQKLIFEALDAVSRKGAA